MGACKDIAKESFNSCEDGKSGSGDDIDDVGK